MKFRSLSFGLLALALMPVFSVFGAPLNPSLAPRFDLSALVDRCYRLPVHEIEYKRPWLNPARAALKA